MDLHPAASCCEGKPPLVQEKNLRENEGVPFTPQDRLPRPDRREALKFYGLRIDGREPDDQGGGVSMVVRHEHSDILSWESS